MRRITKMQIELSIFKKRIAKKWPIGLIMYRMGLEINKEKTTILHTNKSSLHFLGFEFRKIPSKFDWNKGSYTNIRPSTESY